MPELKRTVGLPGAVLLGLGSIVGTGVFVSLGLTAGITGPSVVLAVLGAGVLASLNGVSSAQLAASFPVSGGTYEYAHRTLGPIAGFTAGLMFLFAKGASAATAALGLASYLVSLLGLPTAARTPIAFATVLLLTALVQAGIRRTNLVNTLLVGATLLVLSVLVLTSIPHWTAPTEPLLSAGPLGLMEGTAMTFVAFTGYGRIATLGEEVVDPVRTIPIAIAVTLGVVMVLYTGVSIAAVGVLGASVYGETTLSGAPLQLLSAITLGPVGATVVSIGAMTAMAGVLLNLVLGLSRVALAMGRRGDLPAAFSRLDAARTTPVVAVPAVGAGIAGLTLLGDISTTWSFSAFTVLVYYAITNLAALNLTAEQRRFHPVFSGLGLVVCLTLAVFIDPIYLLVGAALLIVGHGLRWLLRAQGSEGTR